MSIPQPDLFTNPNDLQRNTLQLQTRIVQIAWTDSWKIWNPGSSQIRPRFWHKYSWKWVLWANGQTGGGAKPALALNWIDLERFWQCKSLNWHLPESKKVCKYGATMHIEGSRSLWRKNYLSGGVRSSNWLSSQLENLTRIIKVTLPLFNMLGGQPLSKYGHYSTYNGVTFKEAEKSYQSDRLSLEKFFPHFFCLLEEILNPKGKWKKNSQKILAPFIPVKMAHWEKGC